MKLQTNCRMNAEFSVEGNYPLRIAIVGPECTGKTSLTSALALNYNANWVREYAREYLDAKQVPYKQEDLRQIAEGQIQLEEDEIRKGKPILFCDTNLLVIKVWSEFKYGCCDPWIVEQLKHRKYALHLLTHIDVPWQEDPQREHPTKREELYAIYKNELINLGLPFLELVGDENERLVSACLHIDNLLIHD